MGLQRKPCMAPRKTQLIGWALGASWRLQTDYGATQASLSSSSLALWACGASSVISVTDVRKHKSASTITEALPASETNFIHGRRIL